MNPSLSSLSSSINNHSQPIEQTTLSLAMPAPIDDFIQVFLDAWKGDLPELLLWYTNKELLLTPETASHFLMKVVEQGCTQGDELQTSLLSLLQLRLAEEAIALGADINQTNNLGATLFDLTMDCPLVQENIFA